MKNAARTLVLCATVLFALMSSPKSASADSRKDANRLADDCRATANLTALNCVAGCDAADLDCHAACGARLASDFRQCEAIQSAASSPKAALDRCAKKHCRPNPSSRKP